jgi:hypothetical protein
MSKIIYKSHQVNQFLFKSFGIIATPQTVAALETVSQCMEPLKYKFPAAYTIKVSVDVVKEFGKLVLISGANNAN